MGAVQAPTVAAVVRAEDEGGGEIVAEYTDVIKQFKRMCKSVTPMKCTRGECLMGCENIGQCRKVAFERPAKFEEQVMAWAAEHPEPVYPTWGEWFVEHGDLVDGWQNATNAAWMANTALSIFMNPIPADIAEKLGIEPKEGVC